MKIAFNSTTTLTSAPLNNDITFDLAGKVIYARGVKFGGATYSVFLKHTSTSGGGYDGLVPAPPYVTTTTTRYLTDTGEWKTINFVDTYNKTEIDDLISGAKTYTDTKIANLVNGAPETLDTLKEISDYLQDSTVVGGLLDLFKKYLPLSGGTIGEGNSNSFPLQIASTNSYTGISFKTNAGTAWLRYLGNAEWNVTDLGWAHSYNLIHTGNIGSQSVNNALHLNGIPASNYATLGSSLSHYGILDAVPSYSVVGANYSGGNWLGYTYATEEHGGYVAGGVISAGTSNAGFQLNGSPNTDELYFRGRISGKWGGWKQIAFTHSTVEAANKLSTARTIWGQSFDGSGNVSGNIIVGVEDKDYTTQNYIYMWKGDGTYRHRGLQYVNGNGYSFNYYNPNTGVYKELRIGPNGLSFANANSSNYSFIINSSGNVTIGSSDLAGTGAKLYVDGRVYTKAAFLFDSDYGIWNGGYYTGALTNTDIAYNATKHVFLTGNVGIGTTTPEALLHVAGNTIVNGDISVKGQIGGSNNAWRIVKSGGTLYIQAKDENDGNNGSIALCGHNATKASRITLYSDDIYLQGNVRSDGAITASSFIKSDSSDSYVLLGGGSHKAISDFMLNNLTTITKTLVVSKEWVDTGIIFDSTTFPYGNGSYVVLLSRDGAYFFTGYLTIVTSAHGAVTGNVSDEIILHGDGFDMTSLYYLRTIHDTTNKVIKLLIARSSTYTVSKTYTFKFKKLI